MDGDGLRPKKISVKRKERIFLIHELKMAVFFADDFCWFIFCPLESVFENDDIQGLIIIFTIADLPFFLTGSFFI